MHLPFGPKKNCPPRTPKNAQMSSFSALWTVKTCQIILSRKILGSFSTNYGLRRWWSWWPFFWSSLVFLGKLDIFSVKQKQSYLLNRKQFVSLNKTRSKLENVTIGVPQGSSLGPLFFLIYINDLTNALESKPRLFADDTCLMISADNLPSVQNKIIAELQRLHIWCSVNKLTINLSKTSILIVPPKLNRNINLQPRHIVSNNIPIDIVNSVKYLGVYVDHQLNFKDHIKTV